MSEMKKFQCLILNLTSHSMSPTSWFLDPRIPKLTIQGQPKQQNLNTSHSNISDHKDIVKLVVQCINT